MKKSLRAFVAFIFAFFLSFHTTNVFATNPYGVVYSGGEPLGENGNVQIEPDLINELTPLVTEELLRERVLSDSSMWKKGYSKVAGRCTKVDYFVVDDSDTVSNRDDLSYDLVTDKYALNLQIKNVYLEPENSESLDEGEKHAVILVGDGLTFGGGYRVYDDDVCEEPIEEGVSDLNNEIMFVELIVKLYNVDKSEIVKSNSLYFGIIDIDARQSYKVLNTNNPLSPQTMFAQSAEGLQPASDNPLKKNMYVADGNYIYSANSFDITGGGNDIFVKADLSIQDEGLNIVFGYRVGSAASAIAYYSPQLMVNYTSDDNGAITGLKNEEVLPGGTPLGSTSTPDDGYRFDRWVADKDVKLTDDTEIEAGNPITSEQVAQIVVTEDLTLTAIHEILQHTVNYVSDDNGEITGRETETLSHGSNPSGSESTPEEGYRFDHWIANKDVTLEDGTVITASNALTSEQIEQVVVTEDITFTAIHDILQYTINYVSDNNGEITGREAETVSHGSNPAGSESTPEAGYAFDHWVADKNVTLEDGTVITAGNPVTPEQVEQVVVTENLVFTAIHRDVKLNVTYTSDQHGEITGKTSEKVVPNDNPTGSESTPEAGYAFDHWVADKNVTLEDGTVITAGNPITPEQVEEIVVTEDITLTAIHEDIRKKVTYESDEGGEITGIDEEPVVPNGNPTGSEEEPKEYFVFDHWEADKDVVLEDGTEIKAGDPITPEQVTQIVVTEDIVVTAIHEDTRKTVTYESDEGGEITGIDEEPVVPNGNPTGTEDEPKDEYEFDHWEADKDVVLEDGTEIKAGDPITPEQISHIVVTEDITLTAVHKPIIATEVPDTGVLSKEGSATQSSGTPVILGIIAAIVSVAVSIIVRMQKRNSINRF